MSHPVVSVRTFLACLLLAVPLGACSGTSEPLGLEEQARSLKEDLALLFSGDEEGTMAPLSLYEAIARGIKHNIHHRAAMMEEVVASGNAGLERLKALPAVQAQAKWGGRDNSEVRAADGATTGTETLPPSIFEDRYRQTAGLDFGWNVLEAGLAYARSRAASDEARAASERRRQVVQALARDIRFAYARAESAQILDDRIAGLMSRADTLGKELEEMEVRKGETDIAPLLALQKRLYDTMRELMAERARLKTARAELAALMGLPPNAPFRLEGKEADIVSKNALPEIKTPPEDLDVLALLLRPEMREQVLTRRIAAAAPHLAVLETFPGLSAIIGTRYDSNSFLGDRVWHEGSLSLAASLTKIFTLPARLGQAENAGKLGNLRRMALLAGVVTQTHLARTRYDLARDEYALLKKTLGVNMRIAAYYREKQGEENPLAKGYLLSAEMDQLLARVRLHLAYADGQNAFGQIVSAIGLDPLPPGIEEKSLGDMSSILRARCEGLDTGTIAALLRAIRERTDLLSPSGPIKSALYPVRATGRPLSLKGGAPENAI